MSPAGGNGINYAIHDAVAAANLLSGPLRAGNVSVADLAHVQQRRELPTRIIQGIVNTMQERILRQALDSDKPISVPGFVRWPVVSSLVARVMGFGILPEHVKG
jgi:2-polyprenyl-6-methoxyphenol hydroxylase-like FAD-dependent oxidoreductase